MEWERVTPESMGIPSGAVLELLDTLYRAGVEMHGLVLLRHGKICAQGSWRPYRPDEPHILFSFGKSLTATAIGFAWQEGLLSLEERLVEVFPDKLPPAPSEHLRQATVRDLLTMSCGHETEIPDLGRGDPDWIASFLKHPFVYAPGTHFLYNTAGTNLLSALLTRRTGQSLTQFLKPRLTEPLGMGSLRCQLLPDGTEMGGAGFSLSLEDMARFTQFVAWQGRWDGKQLLDPRWFRSATGKQIENGDPATGSDWNQGYGYQFWQCVPEGVYRGDGAFGQFGVVFPRQDAVLVIQSATPRMQDVLTAVWERLLPAFAPGPLEENPRERQILEARLQGAQLNPVLGMRNPGAEESLNGAVYLPEGEAPSFTDLVGGAGKYTPDGGKLVSLGFRFTEEAAVLEVDEDRGHYTLPIALNGEWATGRIKGAWYGTMGRWRAKDKLEAEIRNTGTVSGKRFIFRFQGGRMTLSGDSTYPDVGGLCDPLMPEVTFRLTEGAIDTKTRMYWEPN